MKRQVYSNETKEKTSAEPDVSSPDSSDSAPELNLDEIDRELEAVNQEQKKTVSTKVPSIRKRSVNKSAGIEGKSKKELVQQIQALESKFTTVQTQLNEMYGKLETVNSSAVPSIPAEKEIIKIVGQWLNIRGPRCLDKKNSSELSLWEKGYDWYIKNGGEPFTITKRVDYGKAKPKEETKS